MSGAGRMKSHTVRRGITLAFLMLGASAIVARAAHLQIVEHEKWLAAAEDQHREQIELPARRGAIYDRNGVPLAMSHEMYQVSVAPRELREPKATADNLVRGLGIGRGIADDAVDPDSRWVVLPGRYTAEQRRAVGNVRGVYFERSLERFYPQGSAGREIVGAVTRDGRVLGGIEQQMDDYLRGTPGYSILRRDARGDAQPAISLPVAPPVDGANVTLTIDFDLQEIADAALRDAVKSTGASGGDLLISDPNTGAILAAVSLRAGRARTLAAITEPYEPGSTLKPFVAATLLEEGAATMGDSVFAENGSWTHGRRTIRDTSPHAWLTLRDALRVSSNIAMVKFATRLSPGQQYSYLRDFGFGTATGIDYPAESTGLLRRPQQWSALSSGSLAIGYELSVTPLQMVAAYGALANGGRLLEPYLVSEVRAADGSTLFRRSARETRRVVSEEVAHGITEVLVSVVEDGTATRAGLSTFAVAGKTGTSRRTGGNGYAAGAYNSTFAGYFPADDPQIVVFVKLDEPEGAYYGGLTAAPVTRETLRSILATRSPTVRSQSLLATRMDYDMGDGPTVPDLLTGSASPAAAPPTVLVLDSLAGSPPPAADFAEVPDLAGLTMREAVRRVHAAGLLAHPTGRGPVRASAPAAGSRLKPGTVVRLEGGAR